MSRYDLTDFEWRVIEPLLPNKPRGVPRFDDRRVLNGIFWVLRSGAPWRDLPERYGPRTTCYNRFVSMAEGGRVGPADGRHHRRARRRHPDDRQHIRSGPSAGRDGKKGGEDHCLGRSRGGLTTRRFCSSAFFRRRAFSFACKLHRSRIWSNIPCHPTVGS
jgi:transposase